MPGMGRIGYGRRMVTGYSQNIRGQIHNFRAAAGAVSIALAGLLFGPTLRRALAPNRRALTQGLLGVLVLTAATFGAYSCVRHAIPEVASEVRRLYGLLTAPPGPRAAIPLLTLAVLGEELVWRGVLYPALTQRMSRPVAVGIATLLYALPQAGSGSWLLVALALGCGSLWTLQREWTNGLLAPTITHLGWSLCLFVVAPLEGHGAPW